VVFFTGDLLDGKIGLVEESMQPLKDLNAPIYFVEGNHDKYTGVNAIKKYLTDIGVNVLTNEVADWNGLQIIGLNHMIADSTAYDMHAEQGRLSVRTALETLEFDESKPVILLHHGPAGIKHATNAGVDLYLAGHTHGGQIFPATLVARAIFEYNKGLHRYQDTYVYVCQGTGTFGPPMRVGTKSEMTILTLKPE
jgi:predicted MPP superfamily phosphohydrolase